MRLSIRFHSRTLFAAAVILLACAYSFLAPVRAEAQNVYYVSPTGSDSNNGSATSPWLTPQHSTAVAKPGDTVLFADGTYNLPASGGTGDWFISKGGAVSLPITYAAQHK